MANLGEVFDTETMPEGSSNFEPIPAGWYQARIAEAGLENTKAGNGQYIKIRYDITGPSHEGRVVFGNLNIRNPNPKAEEIGRGQLGDLMRSIGLAKVTDTDELIGGQCSIKVSIRTDDSGKYEPQNEVKGWKAIAGSKPPQQKATTTGKTASAAPPWAK